ncbi:lig3 [Trypoxylus dichotomus]
MEDNEEQPDEKIFIVEKAKNNRAACKHCKQKCASGEIRFVKLTHNPFGAGKMRNCYHIDCMLEVFLKQRPTTKRIQTSDDLDGFDDLLDEDRKIIEEKIAASEKDIRQKYNLTDTPKKPQTPKVVKKPKTEAKTADKNENDATKDGSKDGLFREFRRLVADITNESSYLKKTAIVAKLFTHGTDGIEFCSDIKLWCRLLLPGVVKRIYNLQSKQLVKLFSRIFGTDHEDMLEHLGGGDVSETMQHFFTLSKSCKSASKSLLTLVEVDDFLEELAKLTKEDEQIHHFKKILPKCTPNDLKIIIRLIKGDLKMNAGAKHILDGIHSDAYQVFQSSRDIDAVIDKCIGKTGHKSSVKAKISLLTPVLPMLAQACRSVEDAMKKCPNGMYSEIKYDGERVQVHKNGSEFQYYSRSLKPVMTHKITHFKDYIPKAFPHGKDLILDSEILMVDVNTGKPLPFGTLGKHKKEHFKDASVCLFVFDCIYYNGEDLTGKPIKRRKEILKTVMQEIPNKVVFAEIEEIHAIDDLKAMIAKVLKLGLEGLVLKDLKSIYEPGKRHWLKVKKDYLFGGAIADTADLIVLGAWYGTGRMGGMMSIFLMGCYDEKKKQFLTVTKVHNGNDDKTIERLQDELDMVKIGRDPTKVPDWLHCTNVMTPDFVARDPKAQPVWEITAAEFTQQHDFHTADGISMRFPRVTRMRDDKTWETATNLEELRHLYKESKENGDVGLLMKEFEAEESADSPKKKKNQSDSPENSPKKKRNRIDSPKAKDQQKNGNILDFLPCTSKADKTETKTLSTKRKSEDDLDNVLKKQKKTNDVSNSPDNEHNSNGTLIEINDPLPDYFEKINLCVHEDSDDLKKWIRYFIAYGGTIVTEDDRETATHVLHAEDRVSVDRMGDLKDAVHITADWIRDSICKGSIQDDANLLVLSLRKISNQNIIKLPKRRKIISKMENDLLNMPSSSTTSPIDPCTSRSLMESLPCTSTNTQPVPNYFKDVFLATERPTRYKFARWIRLFVNYGGVILGSDDQHLATHVLHVCDEEPLDNMEKYYGIRQAIHINIEWIKDTIKKGCLQDDRPYRVTLVGSKKAE